MNELTQVLKKTTSGVTQMYYHMSIDGGNPIFRERVYCYALYHQMRKIWPQKCQFLLNGELDKRAHPLLRKLGADYAKPDFLIHRPGQMAGNYAIIKVKHSISATGIRKDLKTLVLFVRNVGYKRAIYLVYGSNANQFGVTKIQAVAKEFESLKPIEVLLHRPNPIECEDQFSV